MVRFLGWLVVAAALMSQCWAHGQAAGPAPSRARPHEEFGGKRAYVVKGLLGEVFTPGMNEIADRFRAMGFAVRVGNWTQSDDFIADACAHRQDRIIIVGHSMGAIEAANILTQAKACGAHNIAMVSVDPPPTAASVPAGSRAVNFVGVMSGTIAGARNIPVSGYGHLAIVDESAMQKRIVSTALSLER